MNEPPSCDLAAVPAPPLPPNELVPATPDDLAWANLEIQRAQRQIERGVEELTEGIVALALILLDVRRRQLYQFDPEYPTFDTFLEHRHGIHPMHAKMYVESIEQLGEAEFRTLLSDLGKQRTYALAMLRKTDPQQFLVVRQLPPAELRSLTEQEIRAIEAHAVAELRARVADLELEVTRRQGMLHQTRERLQNVDALHRRVVTELVNERDRVQQALEQEQRETERLRDLIRQIRAQQYENQRGTGPSPATRNGHGNTTDTKPALAPGQGATKSAAPNGNDSITEATVVMVTCDIDGIIADMHALARKAERIQQLSATDVAPYLSRLRAAWHTLRTVMDQVEERHG